MKLKLKFPNFKLFTVAVMLSSIIASCDLIGDTMGNGGVINEDELSVDGQKQLNVIYFLPNDTEPHDNYEERLSRALVHVQGYYAKEMESYGFGHRRFGLQEDDSIPGQVKIHLIHGDQPRSYYPYSGGGAKAKKEIDQYFQENPDLKTSEHYLIFIPHYDVGVPFYGLGKYAFVRDYENGYDMDKWEEGIGFPTIDDKWIGGLIHELGHGLNLPHNAEKASDDFIAMMGTGNNKYWQQPENINLTKASSLILRYNEIFNVHPPFVFYADEPEFDIKSQRLYADNENLYVDISFTSSIPVGGVIAYNDPKKSAGDADYNAITWTTTDITSQNGNKKVSFTIPLSGINEEYKEFPFDLKINFVHVNGTTTKLAHKYDFVGGKPDIDVTYERYDDINRVGWSIEEVSHEDPNFSSTGGLAINALDGDLSTVWHTGYQTTYAHPHHIVINMGQMETLRGISMVQNQDNNNGMIRDFKVLVSSDNVTYTEVGAFEASTSMTRQQFVFDAPVDAKYFKIYSTSSYNNRPVTRIAEINAF
ncbi:discoidin domain-containing protein [Joostella sp.]|uniref:discoidin domain-containing protein n=1 Tax=Joostella sp. TaxID=2231138 RepID=UPI003A8DED5E